MAVTEANRQTIDFLRGTQCRVIAELGVYMGHTSREIAKWLDGSGELHLFDFYDRVDAVATDLAESGYCNIRTFPTTYKLLDSYNWPLAKLLEEHTTPIYDYVFIDGAHTWAIDALATLLVDRLLKPGGYLDFDDYGWTLQDSPSLAPEIFPLTAKLYTPEQITSRQVEMICELLIRRDARYEEVASNKIWRKLKA